MCDDKGYFSIILFYFFLRDQLNQIMNSLCVTSTNN